MTSHPNLSFASPEADFTSNPSAETLVDYITSHPHLSFASPEADFQSAPSATLGLESENETGTELSFATPESDFSSQNLSSEQGMTTNELADRFLSGQPKSNESVPKLFEAFKTDLLGSLTPSKKGDMAYSLSQSTAPPPTLTDEQSAMLDAAPNLTASRIISVSEAFSHSDEVRESDELRTLVRSF